MAIKPDCGVGHHKACPCREAAVERLCEAVVELLSECVYCGGVGVLGPRWAYKTYRAPDGSCARCHDAIAALAAVRGPRKEREGG